MDDDWDDNSIRMLGGQTLTHGEYFDSIEKSISFIERVKVVQTQILMLQEDVKEIWNEARDYGLDVSVLKKVLTRMKKSASEREAEDIAVGTIELRLDGRDIDGETYEEDDEDDDGDEERFDLL